MPEDTVMVFTGRPPSQILEEGGTQAWALSAKRARMCKYVVCVQNRETFEQFSPTEPHNVGFLVGKITEVSLSVEQPEPDENRPDRYIIKFVSFARVAIDAAPHREGNRNPVSYHGVYDLGIDPDKLDWIDNDQPASVPMAAPPSEDRPLTIAQAKKGLALTFGVSPEAVRITVEA